MVTSSAVVVVGNHDVDAAARSRHHALLLPARHLERVVVDAALARESPRASANRRPSRAPRRREAACAASMTSVIWRPTVITGFARRGFLKMMLIRRPRCRASAPGQLESRPCPGCRRCLAPTRPLSGSSRRIDSVSSTCRSPTADERERLAALDQRQRVDGAHEPAVGIEVGREATSHGSAILCAGDASRACRRRCGRRARRRLDRCGRNARARGSNAPRTALAKSRIDSTNATKNANAARRFHHTTGIARQLGARAVDIVPKLLVVGSTPTPTYESTACRA